MWIVFIGLVLVLLAVDLGIFNRKPRTIGVKESLWMSLFYVVMGLFFSVWIFYQMDAQSFAEYLTGFVVEKTLSLDNILLISLIFSGLSIPSQYQHRVLFFGILGVIILRGLMIALGAQIIQQFQWVLYLFALFMLFTGFKMFFTSGKKKDIKDNPVLKLVRKSFRITHKFHGSNFFVWQYHGASHRKRVFITPLFVALIVIEFTDLVFAVDSVPAIFAITQNTYIVYTSNIFAILGLRALYFALVAIIDRFHYLRYALALILIFIGSKIFFARSMGWEKFPPEISLAVTLLILASGVLYSLYRAKSADR